MKLLEVIDITPKNKKVKSKLLESVSGLNRPDGVVQVSDNRFLLVINNFGNSNEQRIYGFDSNQAANDALARYTDPNVTPAEFDRENSNNRRTSRWSRATDQVDEAEFQRRTRRSPWLTNLTNTRLFVAFTGLLRIAGPVLGAYYGILAAAGEVMDDDSLSAQEKQEQIDILYGLLITEVTAILLFMFRTARLARRVIAGLRTVTRTITVGAAATGVGTVPGIIGLIASEAGWFALSWALTSSTVQRALAEWLAGTFVGQVFGYIGAGVNAAAAALAEATNDRFGSRDLQRWLGFPDTDGESQLRSAAYGSSEWAKLVMGAIMYPPQADPIVVDYIPPDRREALLAEKLNISIAELESLNPQETDQTPTNDAQPTDDQPGTRSAAAQAADPDGDGNANDPEAQVFAGETPQPTAPRRQPRINNINSISDLGPMP